MMGVMTLALSVFSIVPMSLSLVNRVYLARVIVHILQQEEGSENTGEESSPPSSFDFWGTVSNILENDVAESLPEEENTRVSDLAAAMVVFFIVCIILLVVYLLCSIMLMLGSARGSRWLILPWIVATFLFILAYLVGMALSMWLFGGGLLVLALFAIAFVESCIAFYLWLCVVSLFQALGSREMSSEGWELKPRLNTSYKGIPKEDRL
jgi:hypothetical protein